jgi:SAM-dependent methyltransferase
MRRFASYSIREKPGMTTTALACPLCRGRSDFHAFASDTEYFTTPEQFEYRHCGSCDILFVTPMLADKLDLIYPKNYYSFDEGGEKDFVTRVKERLDARLLRRILRTIPGNTIRVLDVGGGTGWLSSLVRDIDPRVTFTQIVDLDSRAQAQAEDNDHSYFLGRIEDYKSDQPFDLVLMLNLIEHVAHPDEVLTKTQSLLSEKGRVLIKTPNFRALDAVLFRHHGWGGYHCPRHFVLFNRESLDRTLNTAGLAVERFRYTQGAPFWAGSILRMFWRRGIISANAERPYGTHPIAPLLLALTAAFDFARQPFSRLSQMIVVARKARSDANDAPSAS